MKNFSTIESLTNALETAKDYAELSTATKKQVGAVMVRNDRILGVGYNRAANGSSDACDKFDGEWITYPSTAHAEEDIITYSAKNGIKTDEASIVVTHAPCFPCCRLMIQSGIIEVIYDIGYYDMTGCEYMQDNGVMVYNYDTIRKEYVWEKSKKV